MVPVCFLSKHAVWQVLLTMHSGAPRRRFAKEVLDSAAHGIHPSSRLHSLCWLLHSLDAATDSRYHPYSVCLQIMALGSSL